MRPIMGWNRFFASLFALSFASVTATAQTPAPNGGALPHGDFTTAQKQTVYPSIAKTQKNNAAPAGFRAGVGALVPGGVELAPVPAAIAGPMSQTKGPQAPPAE